MQGRDSIERDQDRDLNDSKKHGADETQPSEPEDLLDIVVVTPEQKAEDVQPAIEETGDADEAKEVETQAETTTVMAADEAPESATTDGAPPDGDSAGDPDVTLELDIAAAPATQAEPEAATTPEQVTTTAKEEVVAGESEPIEPADAASVSALEPIAENNTTPSVTENKAAATDTTEAAAIPEVAAGTAIVPARLETSPLYERSSPGYGTEGLVTTDKASYAEFSEAPALANDEQPQENWFILLLKETVETVVLAVVIFLLIRVAVQNYRIEGSSMEPNFHNGEYLLVNKLAYRLGDFQRGDVVVFKYPGDTSKDYIKRVIGLPGDTVEIRQGILLVNGQEVNEPYDIMPMNFISEPPTVVEPGHLYVLGDNRPASSDTRDWGLLSEDLVIGQAWLAIYPLEQFGLVDHPELHFTPGMAQGP